MGVCAFGGGALGASLSCEGAQYRGVPGSGQLAQQQGMTALLVLRNLSDAGEAFEQISIVDGVLQP